MCCFVSRAKKYRLHSFILPPTHSRRIFLPHSYSVSSSLGSFLLVVCVFLSRVRRKVIYSLSPSLLSSFSLFTVEREIKYTYTYMKLGGKYSSCVEGRKEEERN